MLVRFTLSHPTKSNVCTYVICCFFVVTPGLIEIYLGVEDIDNYTHATLRDIWSWYSVDCS